MIEIPARKGKAAHLRRGQQVKIVNTKGQQVVAAWVIRRNFLRHSGTDGLYHSPLEGAGFEPSVSLLDDVLRTPVVRVDVGD